LTRARSQLLVFGDTAALERRSQFQGPAGRQSDILARLERAIAARLLRHAADAAPAARPLAVPQGVPT
jgi:hypothetical protein